MVRPPSTFVLYILYILVWSSPMDYYGSFLNRGGFVVTTVASQQVQGVLCLSYKAIWAFLCLCLDFLLQSKNMLIVQLDMQKCPVDMYTAPHSALCWCSVLLYRKKNPLWISNSLQNAQALYCHRIHTKRRFRLPNQHIKVYYYYLLLLHHITRNQGFLYTKP